MPSLNRLMKPTIVLALLLAGMTGAASASPTLSLDQATQRIQRDSGDRVLSAERRRRQGREWYRFKLLTPEGRVRQQWVDPTPAGRRRR